MGELTPTPNMLLFCNEPHKMYPFAHNVSKIVMIKKQTNGKMKCNSTLWCGGLRIANLALLALYPFRPLRGLQGI